MRAHLDDLPAVHHHQAVGLAQVDRRWAMAMVVRPCTRLSSAFWISFSVSVSTAEVASSRIRMRGFDQQRPGNADALALAARQALAALAHQRVVAVRQAQDEFVRMGCACAAR